MLQRVSYLRFSHIMSTTNLVTSVHFSPPMFKFHFCSQTYFYDRHNLFYFICQTQWLTILCLLLGYHEYYFSFHCIPDLSFPYPLVARPPIHINLHFYCLCLCFILLVCLFILLFNWWLGYFINDKQVFPSIIIFLIYMNHIVEETQCEKLDTGKPT